MHPSREVRKWVYGVALAAIPLLVAFGIIEESQAPLWIALVGAVVAPGLALANLSPASDVSNNDESQLEGEL
jgi:hypothetical protein